MLRCRMHMRVSADPMSRVAPGEMREMARNQKFITIQNTRIQNMVAQDMPRAANLSKPLTCKPLTCTSFTTERPTGEIILFPVQKMIL